MLKLLLGSFYCYYYFCFHSSSSLSFSFHLRSMISILSDWVSFLAYLNLFWIKGFVVVVVVVVVVLFLFLGERGFKE
jgi:hypothetical protein